MRAIFQSLPGLIEELPSRETHEAIVLAILPTVLGEHLRERFTPVSLENGVLTVAVSSLEWKREFREHASEIVYKLNRCFKKSLVGRIETVVDAKAVAGLKRRSKGLDETKSDLPLTPNKLEMAAKTIANAELRKHFLEAATVCITRRDTK